MTCDLLLQLLLHRHALALARALRGGRRLEGAGRGPGGGLSSAAAAAGVPGPLRRRALPLAERWPSWRPVSAVEVRGRAAKGSQQGRPCSDGAVRCPDSGPATTEMVRDLGRGHYGDFFKLGLGGRPWTGESCLLGEGAGAFLDTIGAWEGPSVLPCPGQTRTLHTSCGEA